MNYCGTCKFRNETGHCASGKIIEDCWGDRDEPCDMLLYPYLEGGTFWVGELFGCVHHSENKPLEQMRDGPEMQKVKDALDLYEAQIPLLTPKDIAVAADLISQTLVKRKFVKSA